MLSVRWLTTVNVGLIDLCVLISLHLAQLGLYRPRVLIRHLVKLDSIRVDLNVIDFWYFDANVFS